MNVAVLVSGGKDSILSLWVALHRWNVTKIISILPKDDESLLFHYENSGYVRQIAEMLHIPYLSAIVQKNELKEEIETLSSIIKKADVEAIVIGGILSEFQRYKFNAAAKKASTRCFSPLWRKNPEILMNTLINNNFKVIIISVSSMGLSKDLLGKVIDNQTLNRLKKLDHNYNISLIGEGGEYESFVIDAPFYPSEIIIDEDEIIWDSIRNEGWLKIKKISFKKKDYKN